MSRTPKETQGAWRRRRPSLKPHRLIRNRRREAHGAGGEAWWYEDERGIDVYQHAAPGIITSAFIPWGRILRAAKRCGK